MGFRLVVIHKYKCLHLIFPVEGNIINSIERDLFWLSKLELNIKAVLFFLLSIEAVVGEENPKNRPLSEWLIGNVSSSLTSFLSKSGA